MSAARSFCKSLCTHVFYGRTAAFWNETNTWTVHPFMVLRIACPAAVAASEEIQCDNGAAGFNQESMAMEHIPPGRRKAPLRVMNNDGECVLNGHLV